jgi:thiamine-phosphate pyrophosphorylase
MFVTAMASTSPRADRTLLRTMTRLFDLRGYYAVVDRDDADLARALAAAGACALQVRIKDASTAKLLAAARTVAPIAAEAGALFVVNDRLDVALAAGADAVHLGQDDLPLAEARAIARRARPERPLLIGVSTHDLDQVEGAVRGGADYLGYGPVFATATKENPDPVQGIDALRAACARAGDIPVVAIGGISPGHGPELAAAGAAAACAIAAVNGAPDPTAVGRRLASAWRR